MSESHDHNNGQEQPMRYQIRLKGHLDARWSDWFGGATIATNADGTTLLTVKVIDQAALHGLLRTIRDLGLPLLMVNGITPAVSEDSDGTP